jgi:hypothetical protein
LSEEVTIGGTETAESPIGGVQHLRRPGLHGLTKAPKASVVHGDLPAMPQSVTDPRSQGPFQSQVRLAIERRRRKCRPDEVGDRVMSTAVGLGHLVKCPTDVRSGRRIVDQQLADLPNLARELTDLCDGDL